MRFALILAALIIPAAVLGSGCSSLRKQELLEQKKAKVEQKKKNYAALLTAVIGNNLTVGASLKTIEDTYGKPDDVFHSGSMESAFDIWTYEKILDKGQEDWQPIRLYFNNGKLVSWKY